MNVIRVNTNRKYDASNKGGKLTYQKGVTWSIFYTSRENAVAMQWLIQDFNTGDGPDLWVWRKAPKRKAVRKEAYLISTAGSDSGHMRGSDYTVFFPPEYATDSVFD